MPPMPPMPPPGMAGASFFGCSAIVASVVTIIPAMDAASWRAVRTTLVGSMMPSVTSKFAGLRVVAIAIFLGFEQLADHHSAVRAGVVDDLARRRLNRP